MANRRPAVNNWYKIRFVAADWPATGCTMGRRPHPRNAAGQKSSYPRLYGRHAVFAALDNPERVHRKLYVTHETAKEIVIPKGLTVQYGDSYDLARLIPNDAPHQGYVLEVEPLENPWIGDIFALGEGNRRPLLVLDQVTDPHNVGAIMRSAVAFDAGAVITTQRHSPTESGVLAKSASGALELIPYIQAGNLADTLEELHRLGFQSIGLDSEGPQPLEPTFAGDKIALVLGSEGKGLRQKTRETVTALARLDMPGAIKSLNVSNACAISLYAAKQHLSRQGK